MSTMEVWYAHMSEQGLRTQLDSLLSLMKAAKGDSAGGNGKQAAAKGSARRKVTKPGAAEAANVSEKQVKEAYRNLDKARSRDSMQALSKLTEFVDGQYRIVSRPPIIVPARELMPQFDMDQADIAELIHNQLSQYRATLQRDRQLLVERYRVIDFARKVVGVGSVGTRAYIALLLGRDEQDPLFLQLKEANRSVLEDYLPRSRYRNHGERVVQGQRLMQAVSDIFLGWARGPAGRSFYWRQLRDMKTSAVIENMLPSGMTVYAQMCGWTLARAHARSGDPTVLSAYLGESDEFDKAVGKFSERYADQNELDYREFMAAIDSGRIQATTGL